MLLFSLLNEEVVDILLNDNYVHGWSSAMDFLHGFSLLINHVQTDMVLCKSCCVLQRKESVIQCRSPNEYQIRF